MHILTSDRHMGIVNDTMKISESKSDRDSRVSSWPHRKPDLLLLVRSVYTQGHTIFLNRFRIFEPIAMYHRDRYYIEQGKSGGRGYVSRRHKAPRHGRSSLL
jgi:hypothetical protein